MSHSRNSNSVQSQTEQADEDSDDDGEQTCPLTNRKYAVSQGNILRNNKDCNGDDSDDSDHDSQTDSSTDCSGSSDSEIEPYDSEDVEPGGDKNTDNSEDGSNDECQSDEESNCELCCQAKCNNSNVNQLESTSNGSTSSSTSLKSSTLNTREATKLNTRSFGTKSNVRSNQVQSYSRDSSKNVHLYPVKYWMSIGKTVFVRWTNGLYYLGVIEKIEDDRGLCLIRYEDDSQYWTHFKDIHTQLSASTILSDSDIICSECRDGSSKSPNEIVICDVCNQGYHQLCHKPQIPDSILEPDAPWTCRTCLYALGAREGGAERDTAVGEAMKLTKTVFHYDLSSLTWNDLHQSNRENIYCYCGGPGRYHSRMLQCYKCLQWFHEACIQVIDTPFLYGDHFYKFTCGICNKGEEIVERLSMRWSDLVAVVLNNLCLRHRKRFLDLSSEIVPFIIQNNSKFKTKGYDLVKMSEDNLSQKVLSVLIKYKKKFICDRDREKLTHWALRVPWPFPRPLFFAPKSYWSNCDKRKTQTNNNNHTQSMSDHTRSRSPPAFPLIYGACRKGASIYPKPASMRHLVRYKERKRSRRRSQEKRKSKSSLPGTSSNSNDTIEKQPSSMSIEGTTSKTIEPSSSYLPEKEENSIKNREHLRTKIKITTNRHRRIKRLRSESRNHRSSDVDFANDDSSQNADTGNEDDGNRDVGADVACLEEVIPLPENFEGQNNPFFNINEQSESSNSSSVVNSIDKRVVSHSSSSSSSSRINNVNQACNLANQHESGYQIISSGTCSKLTLKRITGHSSYVHKESPNRQLDKSPEVGAPVHVDAANEPSPSPRKCIIKAQRLTSDGKLEYLLEWE